MSPTRNQVRPGAGRCRRSGASAGLLALLPITRREASGHPPQLPPVIPAMRIRVQAQQGPPAVHLRVTGPDATPAVRIEPRPGPRGTTIEEVQS